MIWWFIIPNLVFTSITVWWYFRHKRTYDFYLAGPMKGYPNGNKKKFLKVAAILRVQGYTVWNPAEQNDSSSSFTVCIKKDIDAVVHKCRAIALLPGWENSLGANTETLCAYVSGKDIYLVNNFVARDAFMGILTKISPETLMAQFELPFRRGYKDFRQPTEMDIPEAEVFCNE